MLRGTPTPSLEVGERVEESRNIRRLSGVVRRRSRLLLLNTISPVSYALNRRAQEPPAFEVAGQLSLHLQDFHARAAGPGVLPLPH